MSVPASHHQLPPYIQFAKKILTYEDVTLLILAATRKLSEFPYSFSFNTASLVPPGSH